MMRSAGILPYRTTHEALEVLIAHPGGPFWARKDAGAWSVIKGVIEEGEEARVAAGREFREETGWEPPPEPWLELGEIQLRSGKLVVVWAAEADYDPESLQPGEFTATVGGKEVEFPEIDKVAWFDLETARMKLNPAYEPILDRLERTTVAIG